MKQKNLRSFSHYFILLILMILSIIAVSVFNTQQNYQILAVVFACLSYFVWGILHHFKEKSLYPEVALEYFLFSLIGAATVLGLVYYL